MKRIAIIALFAISLLSTGCVGNGDNNHGAKPTDASFKRQDDRQQENKIFVRPPALKPNNFPG